MDSNRSIISPLQIDAVEIPGTSGMIGMTVCPGKDEYAGLGIPPGPWKRDLDLDLQVIRDWGARALVSLIEGHEFDLLGVPELPAKVRSLGIIWIHLPIVDLEVPDWRFEEKWEKAGTKLSGILGRRREDRPPLPGWTRTDWHNCCPTFGRVRNNTSGSHRQGPPSQAWCDPDPGAGEVCSFTINLNLF